MLPPKYQTNEMTSGEVTTSTLIIPNVTKQDDDKYYCQVWANNIGVRSEKANLYYSGTYVHIFCNCDMAYVCDRICKKGLIHTIINI